MANREFHDMIIGGGGDTAVEEALYLSKPARKVHLVRRRDKPRAGMILQERLMAEPKIEVLWNTEVTGIRADNQGVRAVDLKSTRNAHTDELSADGYVITDEKCQTPIPGIFVIGELREKYARQIVLSAAGGCQAALAATHYVENRRAELQVAVRDGRLRRVQGTVYWVSSVNRRLRSQSFLRAVAS